eukprot:TRINITY_DN1046_c0_g1_i2.p1 TRINITY_DN1046_c0_g1~~TRINITY_DN1046_c0_g1_i2.p1  ORF type:complete len:466 (+),score=87.98 TRINITY_DN1046_c0_g1_i2:679-2076(+)
MTYPIYVLCRLLLGTLYPGFQSFKAVKTKNIREYVKWMMYWIVFALYTGIESFMDIFVAFWFPFYYEIKIVILMWLLSPVAEGSLGSSITYRKFVHPFLLKEEDEIDKYLTMIGNQGYKTFWKYSNEGFNFITRMVMQTAIKGGGGIITHLKRSYSLSDLATLDEASEEDTGSQPRAIQNLRLNDESHVMARETNRGQKPVGYMRRGPHVYSSGEFSSGYSSTSEFLPAVGEVMDTEDYEIYDPRIHRRYTPISRGGSSASSVTSGRQPGATNSRRKKELSAGFYPLNHSASLPSEFPTYRHSWTPEDSDSIYTGGTVTPSYNPDEEDESWSDTFEEIPSSIQSEDEDEDRTPEAGSRIMSTESLLKSASQKIERQSQQQSLSPKRYKAPEPPAVPSGSNTMVVGLTPRSSEIPIPSPPSKKDSSSSPSTLSPNSKCPHCTIHTWLPHLPNCPNIKTKSVGDKKK